MNFVKRVKTTINKTIKILEKLKSQLNQIEINEVEDHILYPLIEELNLKLAIYLRLLNKNSNTNVSAQIPFNEDWLEQQSLHLLKTGLEVEAFLKNRKDSFDFSSSAICYAKMYEQEINYSFVHWIRSQNSINLPKYFNKVQPGIRALVYANFPSGRSGAPVDFNSDRHGRWQSPELGKTKTIANFNLSLDDWNDIGITDPKTFLREWDKIHTIRNKAAHTEIVTIKDIQDIRTSLSNLANTKVIEKLYKLKRKFKDNER